MFYLKQRSLSVLLLMLATACAQAATPGAALDVTKFGAVGDGTTLNTAAIQKAIDACHTQGGGMVNIPAGRFLTGTIQLTDNVTLHLDGQAVLLGSANATDYRNVDPFTDGTGNPLGYALIVADGASHVGLEGNGTIDGQGKAVKAAQSPYKIRPFLVRWLRCTDVTVKDVHLTNPGAWTLNFFQTHNATITGVTIRSRTTGLANNDGIDLDSCENVRIRNCDIDSGDDALCLKATSPLPCSNITASGCKLSTKCNALKLGTESLGDFDKISLTDSQIYNTGMSGIALYAVDGANLHDVTVSNVTMDGVTVPISIRLGARLKTFRPGDVAKPVGQLHDITIKNVQVKGAKQIGMLMNGVPGHPIKDITLENITIELPGGGKAEDATIQLAEKPAAYPEYNMFGKVMPAYGIYLRHAQGVSFKNVHTTVLKPDARPTMVLIDAVDVTPAGFDPAAAAVGVPAKPAVSTP
jgi:polygalacturonase